MDTSHVRCTKGYSLLQVVVAMGIAAVLMGAVIRSYAVARSSAAAGSCAAKLKALAMDLERYRVDNHCYPSSLDDLYPEYISSENAFVCPEDPRTAGRSYSDFYVPRFVKEKGEGRILLSCPFHQESGKGVQVFLSDVGDHERGELHVATLTSNGGSVSVLRYDSDRPKGADPTSDEFWAEAVAATPNMKLGPGDWVRVPTGEATIKFVDQSEARITPTVASQPAAVMVVDAFRKAGKSSQESPIYSVLRLARGQIYSIVTPGSKYEVVTPTGTAGAKGTKFLTIYDYNEGSTVPQMVVNIVEGEIYVTGRRGQEKMDSKKDKDKEAKVDKNGKVKKEKKK